MYFKFREREDRKLTKAKNTESSNLKVRERDKVRIIMRISHSLRREVNRRVMREKKKRIKKKHTRMSARSS